MLFHSMSIDGKHKKFIKLSKILELKQMSKQKLFRIKKTINILIAVLFIVTLTVASASACSSHSVKNSNSVDNNIPVNSNPVNYGNPVNSNPINY